MSLQACTDTSEAVALEASLGLYLKPASKIKISVQLPKLRLPGQSISCWQVMEKLKSIIRPDLFLSLRTLKITAAVIKLEGELETRASCERALARLKAANGFKLSGFSEWLQIRAAHSVCSGPTRHDWDAFFRDARGVDEMKPGERPDTVHLEDLPVRWFCEPSKTLKPSERILRKAFATFGRIRRLEIPSSAESKERTFGKTSSLHKDLLFEAYIQYEEYVEFATAMDSLRGKKLLHKDSDGKVYSADIKVDFDRTNYLSDRCIKKRAVENKRISYSPVKDASEEIIKKVLTPVKEECSIVNVKVEKDADLEETGKRKKEAEVEAKLLLKELFHRIEITERQKDKERKEKIEQDLFERQELAHQRAQKELKQYEKKSHEALIQQERILKKRLLKNLKAKQEQKMLEIREQLRKELAGRKVLKSVLANTSSKGPYYK